MKNYIDVQMQGMKNYFDKKCKKQAKQIEELKSGIESALNKETEQYRERILALEKILEERDKTLYLLLNKIQSQEIQSLSYDERLSWLQTQASSGSEITFRNSTVISNHNSYNKIGIATSTKERLRKTEESIKANQKQLQGII